MKTSQIRRILQVNLEPYSLETVNVCAVNQLPANLSNHEKPALYVVNCDPIELPGYHWVVVFVPKITWFKPHQAYFFDPLGNHPSKYSPIFHDFLCANSSRVTSYAWNSKTVQPIQSKTCGHFCVYFALAMYKNAFNPHEVVAEISNISHEFIIMFVLDKWKYALEA